MEGAQRGSVRESCIYGDSAAQITRAKSGQGKGHGTGKGPANAISKEISWIIFYVFQDKRQNQRYYIGTNKMIEKIHVHVF